MDVDSVSSSQVSANNASSQAQVRPRPPEQQAQQSQQAQQARNDQAAQENQAAENARAEAERTRPTVNTNGQVVGTRVNTTA